jgi:ribosomal protein S18 acetylase RimI-like enzyme
LIGFFMLDTSDVSLLDNPIWSALVTGNKTLGVGGLLAKRFAPDVAPFAAMKVQNHEAVQSLTPLATQEHRIALFTPNQLTAPAGLVVDMQAPILQMVLEEPTLPPIVGATSELLYETDVPAMLDLAIRTRPGPFAARTIEFGRYFGIKIDGVLVAMAGERFRFGRFVEVSAVCVDPAFRGRGYAAYLIAELAGRLQAEDITPFLHVFASNTSAIALYEKLGFSTRRQFFVTSMRPPKPDA